MRRGARLPGLALGVAGLMAFAGPAAPAQAHTRSQSFSSWEVQPAGVFAVFSVTDLDATRLAEAGADASDLERALHAHLVSRLAVARGDRPCEAGTPRSLASRTGYLRVELRFSCPAAGALRIRNDAFFDLVPSHVHYAHLRLTDGAAVEEIFADARREQTLAGNGNASGGEGASFGAYVMLGIEHIAAGADHVAFLLALLLLCRRLRDVAFLVTGFTLGHSLTLSLAVLGVVRPEVPTVEALIGFTIALVAAENVGVRAHAQRGLAVAAAAGLGALALARAASGVGPPVVTCLGLALFAGCYLPLAHDRDEATRLRPVLTLLFGLVHGFGFASVLLEIGLPAGRLASALFGFNLGVEIGQLAIVSALFGAGVIAWRWLPSRQDPRLALDALSAALCALGLFWFVGRSFGL